MGLLEPQHIILLFMFFAWIIFPIWGYNAGKTRTIGAIAGLLLGFSLE